MIDVFKKERNKSLTEIYENTNKQWKETNKSIQDLKVQIKSIKKTWTQRDLEMKNVES